MYIYIYSLIYLYEEPLDIKDQYDGYTGSEFLNSIVAYSYFLFKTQSCS